MDYSKWIEELLKSTGKYIKEHRGEIITGTTAVVGTGILSSMIWSSHEENAKIEAEKVGYERASKIYGKKYKELVEHINGLERKIIHPDKEIEQYIDDILEEYESAIKKILQIYKSEITKLEAQKSKTQDEEEDMICLVNDYANYKMKLFSGVSDIYFMIGNIEYLNVECIVNAGGVNGAIHKVAGEGLLQECKILNGCKVGEAKITKGYKLAAKYVIHTEGPVYNGSKQNEIDLENCYINSLNLAKENDIHTIAFPIISIGTYGYPLKETSEIALGTASKWLVKTADYSTFSDVSTGAYGYPLKKALEIALGTVSKWLVENADYSISVIMCGYDTKTYGVYRNIWSEVEPKEVTTDNKDLRIPSKQEKDGKIDMSKFEGLGFGIIYKVCDVVMDGNKGFLVWDYIVYNEISFVNEKTKEIKSLYQSISDSKTENEFEGFVRMYGL